MHLFEAVSLAVKNIVSSKTRTILTMLGIIIGVAAVIVIVGLGNGLENYVSDSFSSMGTNTLTVSVSPRGSTRTLDVDGMYEIVKENSQYLEACSPTTDMFGSLKIGSKTLTFTSVKGVSEDYLQINSDSIAQGRGLQYSDMASRGKVCVIGTYLNMTYFGGNGVGQTVRVGGQSLEIVGVLAQKGDTLEEGGTDDRLYLPYSTASRLTGAISSYVVTMRNEDQAAESKAVLERALQKIFASSDYYTVTSMAEMLETMTSMIRILVVVLAGIAAISLVVGGIGIMNIMLVTVKERTREIGIRKAIGAERRSIIAQFLIEAAVLCGVGGLLGITVGYLGTLVLGKITFHTILFPDVGITLGSFAISVALGILFGLYPAAKASRLPPVETLRAD